MNKKRQFKISALHANLIPYDPLVDHHLEYYFASKKNREILVKTKVVNRRNEILDRNLQKLIEHGSLSIQNKFRLKKQKPKRQNRKNSLSGHPKSNSLSKTVGKKQFDQFLQSQRNQIINKTMVMRGYQSSKHQKTEEQLTQKTQKQA